MNTLIDTKSELKAILSNLISFEDAGYNKQDNTLQNVALNLWNECAQYNRGTQANKFKEGLQGLPSYINIPFMNWDISKLMYSIGFEDEETAPEFFWNLCGEILSDEFNK